MFGKCQDLISDVRKIRFHLLPGMYGAIPFILLSCLMVLTAHSVSLQTATQPRMDGAGLKCSNVMSRQERVST